jgi:anti-sigma factor RsiW
MTCGEIEDLAPLYLSGELEEGSRGLFEAHLTQCRSCAAEVRAQASEDARLRDAVSMELPDTSALQASVRKQIGAERVRRFAAVAAAVLFAAALGYWALRMRPPARVYADAALDHRLEVMEHQPRRWRSDPADIAKLAQRFELSNLTALAPPGYRLEHAKMCGIDGKPALHLVYTNGSQEFSIFVRARSGQARGVRMVGVGSESLAGFQTDRVEAVIATSGSSEECLEFARFAQRAL